MIKVMIVDDAAFMRMALRNILERNGYEVVAEAGNGTTGVMKYKQFHPDIVTMDYTMPEMSGIEALKAILQYDSDAKVIMVSAMGQEWLVKESIHSGAKSFIIKPFQEDHVVKTIEKIIKSNSDNNNKKTKPGIF